MPRPPLPRFIADIVDDRPARTVLVAGSAALFAAGLDPKVWGPSLTTVQSAIRQRPELEAYVLVGAVGVGDPAARRRRHRRPPAGSPAGDGRPRDARGDGLHRPAVPLGPIFVASRLVGAAAAAVVFPVSLASVAVAYTGINRATAIGLAYAVYSVGQALMPVLLTNPAGLLRPGLHRRDRRGLGRAVARLGPRVRPAPADRARAAVRHRDGAVGERRRRRSRPGSCGSAAA